MCKGFVAEGDASVAATQRYAVPLSETSGRRMLAGVLRKTLSLLAIDYSHAQAESTRSFVEVGGVVDDAAAMTREFPSWRKPNSAEWFMYNGLGANGREFAAESLLFLQNGASEPTLAYTAFRSDGESPKLTEIVYRRGGLLACIMTNALDEQITLRDMSLDTAGFDPLVLAAAPETIDVGRQLERALEGVQGYESLETELGAMQLEANFARLNTTYGLRRQVVQQMPTVDELADQGAFMSACIAA